MRESVELQSDGGATISGNSRSSSLPTPPHPRNPLNYSRYDSKKSVRGVVPPPNRKLGYFPLRENKIPIETIASSSEQQSGPFKLYQ